MAYVSLGELSLVEKKELKNGHYTIPDNVSKIGSVAFYHCCDILRSVTIPFSVKEIGYHAFHNCSLLTDLALPYSVLKIEPFAFDGCSSLRSLNIPFSVTNIGSWAFSGCSLAIICLPKTIKTIEANAFSSLKWQPVFVVESGSVAYDFVIKNRFQYVVCEHVVGRIIGKDATSYPAGLFKSSKIHSIPKLDLVTEIEANAFEECNDLESIVLPESLVTIGKSAFSLKTPSGKVRALNIPSNVKTIEKDAFAGRQFENITFNKEIITIGEGAFSDAKPLIVYLPKSAINVSPKAFGKGTIVLVDGEDLRLINQKKKNAADIAKEREEIKNIKRAILSTGNPLILEKCLDPEEYPKVITGLKSRIETEKRALEHYSGIKDGVGKKITDSRKENEILISRLHSEESALQTEVAELNEQLEATFFLNLSRKKELKMLIEKRNREITGLSAKAQKLIEDSQKQEEQLRRELALAEKAIIDKNESYTFYKDRLTVLEGLEKRIAGLENISRQNDTTRAEELLSLKVECDKKKSIAEERQKKIALEIEKERLIKKASISQLSKGNKQTTRKEYSTPDEALINNAYDELVADTQKENESISNQKILNDNKKTISRIVEINQELGLEDYADIEIVQNLDTSFTKPERKYFPERFSSLSSLFSANPKWALLKKEINKHKFSLLNTLLMNDLHREFFKGENLAFLKDSKSKKLFFSPFCLLIFGNGSSMEQVFYKKGLFSCKVREFEGTEEDSNYELIGNRYTYQNKDGSKNLRYSNNPLIYQMRESWIRIKVGKAEYLIRVKTKENAEELIKAYEDFVASLNEPPYNKAYKSVVSFADLEVIGQQISDAQQAEKEQKRKAKEAVLEEQKKRAAEQAKKEELAAERRKELIRKQQERNTEKRFDSISEENASKLEIEKQEYKRESNYTPNPVSTISAIPGFEKALSQMREQGGSSAENEFALVSKNRKIFNNVFSLDFVSEDSSKEASDNHLFELTMVDSKGTPVSNSTEIHAAKAGKCRVMFTLKKTQFDKKDSYYLVLLDRAAESVSIMAEFSIDIAFSNDFGDDFSEGFGASFVGSSDVMKDEKGNKEVENKVEKQGIEAHKEQSSRIPDKVLYSPGEEPERIRARLDRLFEKLNSTYPDKVIVGLNKDHKKWGETVTELYRQLGYSDSSSFLNAYGFSTNRTGRPSDDPMEVIEELKRRYVAGATCEKLADLVAENPDLAPKFRNLANQADKFFGMTLGKYLLQEGILRGKKTGTDDSFETLKSRYLHEPYVGQVKDLMAENPDLSWAAIRKDCENSGDGVTLKEFLIKEGILKRKEMPVIEPTRKRLTIEEKKAVLDEIMEFGVGEPQYSLYRLMKHFPDRSESTLRAWTKDIYGIGLNDFFLQGGALMSEGQKAEYRASLVEELDRRYKEKKPEPFYFALINNNHDLSFNLIRQWFDEEMGGDRGFVTEKEYYTFMKKRGWLKNAVESEQDLLEAQIQREERKERKADKLLDQYLARRSQEIWKQVEEEAPKKTSNANLYDDLDRIDLDALVQKAGITEDNQSFPKGQIYTVVRGNRSFSINVKLKNTIRRVPLDFLGFDARKPLNELMSREELLEKYDPKRTSMAYWDGPIEYREGYTADKDLSKRRIIFLRAIGAIISTQEMIESIVDFAPKKKDGSFKRNQYVRIASSMLGGYPNYIFEILGRIKDDNSMEIAFEESVVNENTWEKSCHDFVSSNWNLFQ